MYHSITFAKALATYPDSSEKAGHLMGKNTWDDWHLIPATRPVIASPGVSTKFVEIPGNDIPIDMTEYLCGRPIFTSRSGSFEFYVDNDHEYWETIRMNIANYLHGQHCYISLEDDPTYYWVGRFALSEWKSEANNSKIVIDYTINPFKIPLNAEGNDIIWDNFNFETYNSSDSEERSL